MIIIFIPRDCAPMAQDLIKLAEEMQMVEECIVPKGNADLEFLKFLQHTTNNHQ